MSALATPGVAHAQDEALSQTLNLVPYNSAAQYLEHFDGREVAARMGMSCAFQAFWAGRLVAERTGVDAAYYRDGRHRAAVYTDGATVTVLDPYLLHTSPLRLSADDADGDGVVVSRVDALPYRMTPSGDLRRSSVAASWDTLTGAIRLAYTRYSVRRGHDFLSRLFVVADDGPLTLPPAAEAVRPHLLHPEQNNLSVRVVHPERLRLAEVVLPLRGLDRVTPETAELLISKDNEGAVATTSSPAFDRDLALVCEAIGCTRAEVRELLLDAASVYVRVAPPSRDLAPYSLEQE